MTKKITDKERMTFLKNRLSICYYDPSGSSMPNGNVWGTISIITRQRKGLRQDIDFAIKALRWWVTCRRCLKIGKKINQEAK